MRYNLKNRPVKASPQDYERWIKGFEKELRGIKKAVDSFEHDRNFMEGRSQTIKEILGE